MRKRIIHGLEGKQITGYKEYEEKLKETKNYFEIGKKYVLYQKIRKGNGGNGIVKIIRTCTGKYDRYAIFESPAGVRYTYDYGDLKDMIKRPHCKILDERKVFLEGYGR